MSVHQLIRKQLIKRPIDDVWDFFTDPKNLEKLTPDNMSFVITSENHDGIIYPGQIITYKVAPILNIPLFWMTEITHVIPNKLFVDEQRRGPYKLWHHQHIFEDTEEGVLMTDKVHYELPLSILGSVAHNMFVKRQLNDIFDFRMSAVEKTFNIKD